MSTRRSFYLVLVAVSALFVQGCQTPVEPPATAKDQPKPVKDQPVAKPRPKPKRLSFKPDAKIWLLDDFKKDKHAWRIEPWANPGTLSLEKGALKIVTGEGKLDKSAISRPAMLDMSSRGKLLLDVLNDTGKEIGLAIAVSTGKNPVYFESPRLTLGTGKKKNVAFDLTSEKFKSAGSQWMHKTAAANLDALKRVFVLIYADADGVVYIDNVRAAAR